jgi:tRNA acetyltransferase TAN1
LIAYQLFCGVSVVDGKEWESLKRYNVNELYRLAFQEKGINEKDATGTGSRVKGQKKEAS